MKCFYHPEHDAVGMCAQCGKAACRDCIEDIGSRLLCKGCMVQALNRREDKREASAIQKQITRDAAARKCGFSKKLFIGAAAVITVFAALSGTGNPKAPPVAMSPVTGLFLAYLIWSCYWGIPPVWRGWWGMFRQIGCFLIASPIMWIFIVVAFFEIPVFVGYMYGVFGGGFWEYYKCRQIAKT
jgi:hypothetical protein